MIETNLAATGEDAIVAAAIAAVSGAATGGLEPGWLLVGPGDDAAVLELSGRVVVSTDTLVEGFDFVRDWCTGQDVGIKTAAQNFADVAAMGAAPRALLVSLAAPGDLPARWAAELSQGLALECGRAGARVVGGDVSASTEVVVTGTALGVLVTPEPVRRSGAAAGDVVALAGGSGRSAAGLDALRRLGAAAGEDAVLGSLVADHLRPQPPYLAGIAAARAGATAMIDTSDGLARDATRIAVASGVVIDLDPVALHPDDALTGAAARLGMVALDWVIGGGEDHALLACFRDGATVPAEFRVIGRVRKFGSEGPGVLVDGQPWTGASGFRHFSS